MIYMAAVGVLVGAMLSNFTIAALSKEHDWNRAVERSLFQAAVLVALFVALTLTRQHISF